MKLSSFIAEGYRNFPHVRGTSVAASTQRNAAEFRTANVPGPPDPVAGNSTEWQEVSVAKEDRGFASMDRVKQREIASKGGKAAHAKGTAHEWTSDEAREAGRKGGMASHRRRKEMLDDQGGSLETPTSGENLMGGGDADNEQFR